MKKQQYRNSQLEFRSMVEQDITSVRKFYDLARSSDLCDAGIVVDKEIPYFSRGTDSRVVVSVLDGQVVAFVDFTTSEICGLYVDPIHEGKGVARMLLGHAMRAMDKEINAEVLAGNERAISFFFRQGFQVVRPTTVDILETQGVARGFLLLRKGGVASSEDPVHVEE